VQQVASRFELVDRGGQVVVSHGQTHLQPDSSVVDWWANAITWVVFRSGWKDSVIGPISSWLAQNIHNFYLICF
jgi:hypothetical protein